MPLQKIIKIVLRFVLLLTLASSICPGQESVTPTVRTANDFKNACQKAGLANKKIAVVFFDDATVRHPQLFPGPMAKGANENYSVLYIGKDTVPGVEALFRIARYPTLLIVDSAGAEIDRIAGPWQPQDAFSLLRACATGTSELETLKILAASPKGTSADRLNLANAYRKRDKLQEAIGEYGRVLETESKSDPASVRVNFQAVQRLSEMGKTYPEALAPLRKQRDKIDANRALAKNDTKSLQSLFSYNLALGEGAKNAEIYLGIPDANVVKQRLFAMVFPQLVETRNYAAIMSMVDIESHINAAYPRFLFEPGHSVHDGHDHSHQERAAKQRVEAITKSGVEVCIGTNGLEKARRLAARALDYTQNSQLSVDLIDAAKRANNPALAKEFENWITNYMKIVKLEK